MMKALFERAEQAAAARQRAAIERIGEAMQGVAQVEFGPDEVRMRGQRLIKRWLTQSSLRFIGDLAR